MTDKFQNYGGMEEPAEKTIFENEKILTSGNKNPFENYMASTNQLTIPDEAKTVIEKPLSDQKAPEPEKDTNQYDIEKLIIELNNLVGLTTVKSEIQALLQ